jgi:hypothetical protein
MSKLLGKKRPTKDTEDDDELSKLKQPRTDQDSQSDESEKEEKPKKTLFGDAPTSKGIFGNLEEKKDDKSKLFQDKGASNHFAGSSIFSGTGSSSLFNFNTTSSGSGSLFGGQKLFADFSSLKKDDSSFFTKSTGAEKEANKSDDEDGEEGDDVLQGSESPNAYNPTLEKKDEKSDFVKKFVRQIDNVLVYNKEENKFVSKGSGYISIEYTEVGKKSAFIVFR